MVRHRVNSNIGPVSHVMVVAWIQSSNLVTDQEWLNAISRESHTGSAALSLSMPRRSGSKAKSLIPVEIKEARPHGRVQAGSSSQIEIIVIN